MNSEPPQRYVYYGDRLTHPDLKRRICTIIRDERGKCIRGRNGSMLVQFEDWPRGPEVVIGRLLRKVKPSQA